jgi:hypothetical protein
MESKYVTLNKIKSVAEILNINNINYIIGASSALLMHGLEVLPNDLDIVVDSDDLDKTKKILAGYDYEIHTFPIHNDEVCEIDMDGVKVKVNKLEAEYKYYLKRKGESEKVDTRIKMIEEKLNIKNKDE